MRQGVLRPIREVWMALGQFDGRAAAIRGAAIDLAFDDQFMRFLRPGVGPLLDGDAPSTGEAAP